MHFTRVLLFAILIAGPPLFAASDYTQDFLQTNFQFGPENVDIIHAPSCPNAEAESHVSTQTLNFGSVPLGQSKTLTVFFRNTEPKGKELSVQIISIETLDKHFVILNPISTPLCLPEQKTIAIQIQFTPTSSGPIRSQLAIYHSSTIIGGPFVYTRVTLNGGGESLSVFTASPTSLNFGQVRVGQSLNKNLTITNKGAVADTISQIKSNNSAFQVSGSFPINLTPGASAAVNVQFSPAQIKTENGLLSILNGKGVSGGSVPVSGVGIGGTPDINVSPTSFDFGSIDVGTFKTLTFTISNTGQGTLNVTMPVDPFVKTVPGGFFQVAAGKSVQVKLNFIAAAAGPVTDTFNVLSNDPDESNVPLSLTATGVPGPLGLLNRTLRSRLDKNTVETTGVQLVDFNGDGRPDVFFTGHNGNALFKNTGNGLFTNVTGLSRLGNLGKDAKGASWADVDNDGDLDLFISNINAPAQIYKNNNGVFAQQTSPAGPFSSDQLTENTAGGIWFDFNNDGKVDAYVVKDGAPNELLKNTGFFKFVNVASSAKVNLNSIGRSAISADFNDDGYADLYVVNEGRPNKLYINNKNETFRDVTVSATVGFTGQSQQAVASDYDADGDMDILLINPAGPSVLYRNQGNLKFQNVAGAAGIAGPRNVQSASFADVDNDGDQDLVMVQSTGGNVVFKNNGTGKFVKVTNVDLTSVDDGSSASTGDLNGDGTSDVLLGDSDGGVNGGDSFYQNTGGTGNNWLILTLQGTTSNRSAIGATVILRAGLIIQGQQVSGGNGSNQETLPLEFGLGTRTQADTITIAWPDGKFQTLTNVAANQRLTIVEE